MKNNNIDMELAARNLAMVFLDAGPVSIAFVLQKLLEFKPPDPVQDDLVVFLENQIMDSTPSQLSEIVRQAKKLGLWEFVQPAVMARNRQIGNSIAEYTNPDALDSALEQLALASGKERWLPGPIYSGAGKALAKMAGDASREVQDILRDLAIKWRLNY